MANVTVFDISGGKVCAIPAEEIAAAQEVQTHGGPDSGCAARGQRLRGCRRAQRATARARRWATTRDGGERRGAHRECDTARYKSGGAVTVPDGGRGDPLGCGARQRQREAVQL